ncbi:MAG: phage major tail protein, TP901-1 family, partial [Asticcacaulis sp.]
AGGWRELLAGGGVKSLSVSGAGVFRDEASDAQMREVFFSQTARQWQIVVPHFGQFQGAFLIASLDYAGEHDGEATFAVTLASAGEVSFVAL